MVMSARLPQGWLILAVLSLLLLIQQIPGVKVVIPARDEPHLYINTGIGGSVLPYEGLCMFVMCV